MKPFQKSPDTNSQLRGDQEKDGGSNGQKVTINLYGMLEGDGENYEEWASRCRL